MGAGSFTHRVLARKLNLAVYLDLRTRRLSPEKRCCTDCRTDGVKVSVRVADEKAVAQQVRRKDVQLSERGWVPKALAVKALNSRGRNICSPNLNRCGKGCCLFSMGLERAA